MVDNDLKAFTGDTKMVPIFRNERETLSTFTERMRWIFLNTERVFPGRIKSWELTETMAEFEVRVNKWNM